MRCVAFPTTIIPLTSKPVRRKAPDMAELLEQRFNHVERLADQYAVPQSGRQLIAKARKNIGQLVATIAFFWQMFAIKMAALKLPEDLRVSLASTLLSASYLDYASQRAATADERRRLQALSQACLARVREGPLGQLDAEHQEEVQRVVRDTRSVPAIQFLCRGKKLSVGLAPSWPASLERQETGGPDDAA